MDEFLQEVMPLEGIIAIFSKDLRTNTVTEFNYHNFLACLSFTNVGGHKRGRIETDGRASVMVLHLRATAAFNNVDGVRRDG